MAHCICPPWVGYFLVNPLRRLVQKPERILAGLVTPGMTVLDVGPGMGFFTLPLARMVGPGGTVVAVDVQEVMVRVLRRRAERAGLSERIVTRVCPPTSLEIADFAGRIDFALVYAVVHELPDAAQFFAELAEALKPEAQCLLGEPAGHVSANAFAATLETAQGAGLGVVARPQFRGSRSALLSKGG
jgi:2-polyprenyl-3-methyl-5-hydroxy-6-metoxy-1,4-benzoquinol methylase